MASKKKVLKKKSKTKFEEFLEMDKNKFLAGHEEDLEMERKLAKKLKIKGGKLNNLDGINDLFDGLPSALDSPFNDNIPSNQKTEANDDINIDKFRKREKPLKKKVKDKICDSEKDVKATEVVSTDKSRKRKKQKFIEQSNSDVDDAKDGEMIENAEEDFREDTEKSITTLKALNQKTEANDDKIIDKFHKRKKPLKKKVKDKTCDSEKDVKVTEVVSTDKNSKRKKQKSIEQSNSDVDDTKDGEMIENAEEDFREDKEKSNTTLRENQQVDVSKKYVPPHLRACTKKESEEIAQIRRRVRGLLNRLSESNVESITGEISSIFQSLSRSVGCQIIGEEVVASCARGPRGNEQYAAVFAAFVAGMACLVGIDFGAKLVASVAKSFEEEYSKDDGLSLRNLTLLLSYLCIFGVCSSDLIYDLLSILSKRLTEMDVSTILTILQCCGMKLRSDDPTAMKDFVLNIQRQANEAKLASENGENGKARINSKRMDFMLDTICDIKNNKKKPKDEQQHTRIKKWLQKLRAEEIILRGLKWKKLLDPEKKGQWWLSGEFASKPDNTEDVATTIDKEIPETQKLLQLAAAQRMNTDLRRAIFCIIMSGEDYIDAFEKLLRLNLSGKQDREIMRVLVECCLQEKVFNKYYTVLAAKLCSHDKNNKFSLQYCIWDHYKELDTAELIRSMNLAKFVAEMLSSFSLSLAMLKIVDFMDPSQLTARRIMHFRILTEEIFEKSDDLIWNIFTRVSATPELESLRTGLLFFTKQYVHGTNVAAKLKIVKKAFRNAAGILM